MSILGRDNERRQDFDCDTTQEKDQDQSCLDRRAEQLHKIAIKWHTIRKDLSDIQEHIIHLRRFAEGQTARGNSDVLKSPDAVDALKALESTCRFWSRWVTTYLERTNIRINLVSLNLKSRHKVPSADLPLQLQMHHLAAQNTSTLATDVALQTQRDSVSMFTLAMVTAVFLPGTFVCVRVAPPPPPYPPWGERFPHLSCRTPGR